MVLCSQQEKYVGAGEVELGVAPLTITSSHPPGGFILPVSTTLGSAG